MFGRAQCSIGLHKWSEWDYAAPDSCQQVRTCARCGNSATREADHDWGEWAYSAPDSCQQVRTCARCGSTTTREADHDWGEVRPATTIRDPWDRYVMKLRQMRSVLSENFSASELRDLCMDMGLDHEELPAEVKSDLAREVVRHLARHDQLQKLDDWIAKTRADLVDQIISVGSPRAESAANGTLTDFGQTSRLAHLSWDSQYVSACQFEIPCKRCGAIRTRVRHEWTPWDYLQSGSCAIVRHCPRCGREETGHRAHLPGIWQYEQAGACKMVRHCTRCGTQIETRIEHQWSNWEYPPNKCDVQTQRCLRCGQENRREAPEIHQMEFQYSEEGYNPGGYGRTTYYYFTCSRCGIHEKRNFR